MAVLHTHPLDPVSKRYAAQALHVNTATLGSASGFHIGGPFAEDRRLSSHRKSDREHEYDEELRRQTPFTAHKTRRMMDTEMPDTFKPGSKA